MSNDDKIKLSPEEAYKLEKIREEAYPEINQAKLAEKAYISLTTYQRLIGTKKKDANDNNIYHPAERTTFENIAEALGIKPTDFIDPDKWTPDKLKQHRSIFQSLIDEKTQRFVGRKFVFDAFNEFINSQKHGYFTVVGDPGEGKSAIASYYIKSIAKYDCLYYFNVYSDSNNRVDQFLRNICQQLITYYQLNYQDLPQTAGEDGNFFKQLLQEVSKKLGDGEKLIIVIDALDEVDLNSQKSGANYLYLPRYLPDNIYFFLTIRRKTDRSKLLFETPTKIIDLKDYQLNSMDDMKAYIRLFFDDDQFKHDLNEWIGKQNITREDFINKLVEKSKSEIGSPNFMYLRYILPQIARGYYQDLDNIDDLPDGLLAYYYDHWHKMNMTPVKINLVYRGRAEICVK